MSALGAGVAYAVLVALSAPVIVAHLVVSGVRRLLERRAS